MRRGGVENAAGCTGVALQGGYARVSDVPRRASLALEVAWLWLHRVQLRWRSIAGTPMRDLVMCERTSTHLRMRRR